MECPHSYSVGYDSKHYWVNVDKVNEVLWLKVTINSDEARKETLSVPNVPYSKTIRELSTKFSPTITRNAKSGNITSIGIRATNRACAIPKSGSAYTRADFFAKIYGTSKVCEFDVKSSIYRVTYFMNTGKWMDNSIDFYEKMCPYTFTDDTDRDNYKQICMRLYFGKSAADVYAKMWRSKLIDKNTRNEEFVRQMYNNMRKVVRHHIRK